MLWGESENLLVIRITWQGIECVELDELVAFSTFVKGTIIWDNTEIHARLHEYIISTTEIYTEQLNLNEQATNLQLGIMEALNDPLLNFDVISEISLPLDHTSDIIPDIPEQSPISLTQSEISLPLDHTSDIISDIPEQSPISLAQAQLLSELEFTTTERGAQCLLENGFSYTKHRIRGNIVQWQCVQRGVCNARIHTQNQIVVNRINGHNHENNPSVFHCLKVKTTIKRRAYDTQDGTHNILTSSLKDIREYSAIYLPKLDSLKQTFRRARKRALNVPPESETFDTLVIPEAYKKTSKGDRFLLYDSGTGSENQRLLIFGTASNIDMLNTSNIWLADGTFKTAPNLFYQLYVIHALKGGPNILEDGHLLPSLFILLSNKSENIYGRMWEQIKILCPNACPSHLIVDFELAAINSFSLNFPGTQIKGCFFHLTQNLWRKIQELGLKARYQQDPSFALQVRLIPSLAFATPTDVPDLFSHLFATLPPESYDLALYFERTYIGRHMNNSPIVVPPLFPVKMWNNHFMVHHSLPRTTNSVEAWHRSFTSHMACHHPSIWKFVEVLKKEQDLVEIKQAFSISGRNPTKRKLYRDREQALKTLVDNYLSRPKLEFLKGIAYQFAFID